MKKSVLPLILCLIHLSSWSQTNIKSTNSEVLAVLKGLYNPADYAATNVVDNPQQIINEINARVSPDSLKSYITKLALFENRNTGSDTISNTRGIGAARRWIYSKFQSFNNQNGNRLLPSFLQFDLDACGMGQHRNVFAVLPGQDTSNHQVFVIEGHMDSRCDERCGIDCLAQGVEDNASGTVLVMELARVMSQFAFKNTLVFLITTGEEQGLLGADAFADYCVEHEIPVKGVLNNDIVGGIICGKTSSPPSCPGENEIDSTQVRLFSFGSLFSTSKQWARYIKLQYEEELRPIVSVPMQLTIMSGEDRSGRGGDHIPFRQKGIPSMRFTSANEHGDGAPDADYTDRQHTSDDVLGADTNGDGTVDSFFVDFNYLARNVVINGVAATSASQGVQVPQVMATLANGIIRGEIVDPLDYNEYRVTLRSTGNEFDTIFTISGTKQFSFSLGSGNNVFTFISAAAVNENGIESCFTNEIRPSTVGVKDSEKGSGLAPVQLFQNKPNPFDEATFITYEVKETIGKQAFLVIRDIRGKIVKKLPAPTTLGLHEILYHHGYHASGTYIYSIEVDGQILASERMIFTT